MSASDRLSGTFSGFWDRVTFLISEAEVFVLGVFVSVGVYVAWFRPTIPGVPPIAIGIFAAFLLLGPPLFGFFVWGIKKLRVRNRVTVHEINGVTDTREKWYVKPEVWKEKVVEGPSPYVVNDGDAFEVREFDWHPDQGEDGTLIVTGCYYSQMADSKLVTIKAMLEDIHGDLIEDSIALNRLRGRISKMGVQIERDTINFSAEADERGLKMDKTSVKQRFETAKKEAEQDGMDELHDLEDYGYDPVTEPEGVTIGEPGTAEPAATDGGHE
ncbi:hypothetical protein [Natrononativus amylolyticus]|uniref:hypothetical protein n=1 Tax=Natrononativus amylolyticus TaxID=2963434 RepID=UPI0020CED186|nr:hypothetical protein [Natrononativus amylolyticus]